MSCRCDGIEEKYDFPSGKPYMILCRGCHTWLDITIPDYILPMQWDRYLAVIKKRLNQGLRTSVFDPAMLEKEPSDVRM